MATYPFLQVAFFFLIADTITISAKVNCHFLDNSAKRKPFRPQRLYNAVAGLIVLNNENASFFEPNNRTQKYSGTDKLSYPSADEESIEKCHCEEAAMRTTRQSQNNQ